MKSISNSQFSNIQNSQITSVKDSVKNNGVTTLEINESSVNNFVNNYNNNNNFDKIKTLNDTIRKKTVSENSKQDQEEEEENKSTFDKIVR
jgi:hypothetical protein